MMCVHLKLCKQLVIAFRIYYMIAPAKIFDFQALQRIGCVHHTVVRSMRLHLSMIFVTWATRFGTSHVLS